MYVTRRFLRSTIPPSDTPAPATGGVHKGSSGRGRRGSEPSNQPEDSAFDSPSPRRRPLLRTKRRESVDSDDAPVSEPETAPKIKASLRVSRKATAAHQQQRTEKCSKETAKAKESKTTNSTIHDEQDTKIEHAGLGLLVDARDAQERWCEAKIVDVNAKKKEVFVHYVGWNARYDAWLSAKFLAAHGSHTGEKRKNASSWDGKSSLFVLENAVKKESGDLRVEQPPQQQKTTQLRSPASATKRSPTAATKQKKKAVSVVRSASPVATRKRHSRRGPEAGGQSENEQKEPESEHDSAPRKRAKRAAATSAVAGTSVKAESAVKAEPKPYKENKQRSKKAATKVQQPSVRVVVDTTDEASERKSRRSRRESVDMELDMDIVCESVSQSASASEDEAIESESETAGKAKKKKRIAKSSSTQPKSRGSVRKRAAAARAADDKEKSEHESDAKMPPLPAANTLKEDSRLNDEMATPDDVEIVTTAKKQSTAAAKMKKKMTTTSKPATSKSSHSHHPARVHSVPHAMMMTASQGAHSNSTRERLAAIFRLRVQQKQQLQAQLSGGMGQRSLQEEVMQAAAAGMNPLVTTPTAQSAGAAGAVMTSTHSADDDRAAQEAYVHYHHAQQLQQYYYQQAMLASSMHMMDTDEDATMQGGIMDPRVIQARMDALELQRRIQQQQLHDYYQHVAITRERNMQALASSQQFLAKSGHAWQQQTEQMEQHGAGDQPAAAAAAAAAGAEATQAEESETRRANNDAEMDELEEKMHAGAQVLTREGSLATKQPSEGGGSDAKQKETASASDSPASSSESAEKQLEKPSERGSAAKGVSTSEGSIKSSTGGTEAETKAKAGEDKGSVLYEFVL